MPMKKKLNFSTQTIFITYSNIKQNFEEEKIVNEIKRIYKKETIESIFLALEEEPDNKHIHLTLSTFKSKTYRYRDGKFNKLSKFLDNNNSYKHDHFRKKTGEDRPMVYHDKIFNVTYTRADFWKYEKIRYCWIDNLKYKKFFPKEKYEHKLSTLIKSCQEYDLEMLVKLENNYEQFIKNPTNINIRPFEYLGQKIANENMTEEDLRNIVDGTDKNYSLKMQLYTISNFDKLMKMIDVVEETKLIKLKEKLYLDGCKTYKEFQKEINIIFGKLKAGQILAIHDQVGHSGKTYWAKNEQFRKDTIYLTNSKTRDLSQAWNPKIHKRVIFNISRSEMMNFNYTCAELLSDGAIFSPKYISTAKVSLFRPKVIVLCNEPPANTYSEGRLEYYKLIDRKDLVESVLGS